MLFSIDSLASLVILIIILITMLNRLIGFLNFLLLLLVAFLIFVDNDTFDRLHKQLLSAVHPTQYAMETLNQVDIDTLGRFKYGEVSDAINGCLLTSLSNLNSVTSLSLTACPPDYTQ